MPNGGHRTRLKGIVTSDKMDKTIIVSVERRTQNPLYRKYITRHKNYSVHDEQNRCKNGDVVEIISSRPFSKSKSWAVTKILNKAQTPPSDEMLEKEESR